MEGQYPVMPRCDAVLIGNMFPPFLPCQGILEDALFMMFLQELY